MTLTLDLTPEEETHLQALAAYQGMDLTKFARLRLGLMKANGEAVPPQELFDASDPDILPYKPQKGKRIMGLHQGQAWMSDDFDAPMTDEFTEGKLF